MASSTTSSSSALQTLAGQAIVLSSSSQQQPLPSSSSSQPTISSSPQTLSSQQTTESREAEVEDVVAKYSKHQLEFIKSTRESLNVMIAERRQIKVQITTLAKRDQELKTKSEEAVNLLKILEGTVAPAPPPSDTTTTAAATTTTAPISQRRRTEHDDVLPSDVVEVVPAAAASAPPASTTSRRVAKRTLTSHPATDGEFMFDDHPVEDNISAPKRTRASIHSNATEEIKTSGNATTTTSAATTTTSPQSSLDILIDLWYQTRTKYGMKFYNEFEKSEKWRELWARLVSDHKKEINADECKKQLEFRRVQGEHLHPTCQVCGNPVNKRFKNYVSPQTGLFVDNECAIWLVASIPADLQDRDGDM
jgi:hypothetical protein